MRNADMPAMPNHHGTMEGCEGLTKREHFAAMALQGLLSGPNGDAAIHPNAGEWLEDISESAVEFADALLAELEKTQ